MARERAISPVVGVILMVAVTVILSATIGVFVLDMSESVDTGATQATSTALSANSDTGHEVSITNMDDSIPTDSLVVKVESGDKTASIHPDGTIEGDLQLTDVEGAIFTDEWGAGETTGFSVADSSAGDTASVTVVDTADEVVLTSTDTELISASAAGGPYESCLDLLSSGAADEDGYYEITSHGETFTVYCDMTTDGGGWTAIDTTTAREMVDAAGSGGLTGYDSIREIGYYADTDRPYYLNDADGGARYDIPLDFTYDEFYLDSVRFRPTSFIMDSNSHTSEYLVHTGSYVMSDWSETTGFDCDGDIGFGSPADSGPAATFAESGTGFEETGSNVPDDLATFHANGDIYTVTQEETFRMQFTENCGQDEGWMWHDGQVFVR